ncbi:MAG: DUF6788 family protein [Candidatus Zixiibacteriota bacterium]
MKHKSNLSKKERTARSKAAKIISRDYFIQGSLVKMARVCGKETCKCTRGEKHVSLYLAIREDNKRKMLYIPRELETQVKTKIAAYKDIKKAMELISDNCLKRLTRQGLLRKNA